jgi:large subunit ribosomal protein L23
LEKKRILKSGEERRNSCCYVNAESKAEGFRSLAHVIIAPRITEKATFSADKNVYVFDVGTKATKHDILKAVKELYNVVPLKIAVVTIPAKKVLVRGKKGVAKGGKKAYVYLDKKDKIEIV